MTPTKNFLWIILLPRHQILSKHSRDIYRRSFYWERLAIFLGIPSGPSAYIMAQILVYWLSKLANNLWYVNLYLLRPLQAWPQQKTQIYNKSKCLPEIRGLSCTQKTVIPMSPKILEHTIASTEPFPKQVFERVFNEKLNSI